MAKARRNGKTHPKPRGDDAPGDYMPPEGGDAGNAEVVDLFAKEDVIDTAGEGGGVDLDSAAEGDGRSMASEGGEDAADAGGRTGDDVRPARGDRAPRQGTGRVATEADGERYSARVHKRIGRERALVNRERALREQVQRELAEERVAGQARDERLARLERAQTEVAGNADVKALEQQIRELEPKIAAFIEAGNTVEAVKLQSKLGDLQADLKVLQYDLRQQQNKANVDAAAERVRRTAAAAATTTTAEVEPEAKALAEQFKKANRHWWNRSANLNAREDAVAIDAEILTEIKDGDLEFEPYSDEHWEEVARRLHQAYPHLEIQDLDGQPYEFADDNDEDADMNDNGRRPGGNNARQNGQRQQGGRGTAPVNRMGTNGRRAPSEIELARQGKVTLNDEDRATMRLFKLDPNDPAAKKAFANEKRRSILTGLRQPTGGNQ